MGAAAAAAAAPGRARARQHRRYAALSLSPLCSPCLVPELLRLPLGAGRWGCFRELCPASTGPNSNGGRGFTPVLSTAEPQCRFRGLVGCHFWPSRAGGRVRVVSALLGQTKFEFTLHRIRVFGNWPSRTNSSFLLHQICVYFAL